MTDEQLELIFDKIERLISWYTAVAYLLCGLFTLGYTYSTEYNFITQISVVVIWPMVLGLKLGIHKP